MEQNKYQTEVETRSIEFLAKRLTMNLIEFIHLKV